MIAIHFATLRVLRYSNDISIRKTNAKIWQNEIQRGIQIGIQRGIQIGIQRGIQIGIQEVNMQSGKRISQSASGRQLRHLLVISLFPSSS